jgi:malonate-semialdehyde dehydrogenase (acetylating) / methylmalonate-semialdehyde dehydrogenase
MDVATNVRTLQNYVNGEWVASGASETLVVPDPATGEDGFNFYTERKVVTSR